MELRIGRRRLWQWQLFSVSICLLLLLPAPFSIVCCTPLDDYVSKPDAHYEWHDTGARLKGRFVTGPWNGVVLNMTSQAWLSSSEVDRSVWTHHLVIVTPKRVVFETAFLLIGGGSNGGDLPKATDELVLLAAALAVKTQTLAAVVFQVPNQPLRFESDKLHSLRSEDDIIACEPLSSPFSGSESLIYMGTFFRGYQEGGMACPHSYDQGNHSCFGYCTSLCLWSAESAGGVICCWRCQ